MNIVNISSILNILDMSDLLRILNISNILAESLVGRSRSSRLSVKPCTNWSCYRTACYGYTWHHKEAVLKKWRTFYISCVFRNFLFRGSVETYLPPALGRVPPDAAAATAASATAAAAAAASRRNFDREGERTCLCGGSARPRGRIPPNQGCPWPLSPELASALLCSPQPPGSTVTSVAAYTLFFNFLRGF